ncbi:hypothetical protein [Paenibacillus sp. 481]|uniref:hypothetical protein n=1 Tax=Paenibacillus sp. 481 TaxID=2835869 RepID=UPI001E2DAB19|nr:hypothetical protein [Paenibacillus sp. 481]UHA74428.1 hypothetical protein KIK04_04790 [Paenibacillus sp. 481]
MANRNTLHAEKLVAFMAWLVSDGWTVVPNKGEYEVLRATKSGRKPLIVYTRNSEVTHLTVPDSHMGVLRAFIRDTKAQKAETKPIVSWGSMLIDAIPFSQLPQGVKVALACDKCEGHEHHEKLADGCWRCDCGDVKRLFGEGTSK